MVCPLWDSLVVLQCEPVHLIPTMRDFGAEVQWSPRVVYHSLVVQQSEPVHLLPNKRGFKALALKVWNHLNHISSQIDEAQALELFNL